MEKISIILPVYNAEKTIEKCIESIVKQSYTNFQLIIIDDFSTDNTYNICNNFKNNDNRIEIYRNNKNIGVSKSRNIGINKAVGKFVTFIDADDYIDCEIYKELICCFKFDVQLTACDFYFERNKDIKKNKKMKNRLLNVNQAERLIFLNKYFCGFVWNKIYLLQIIKDNDIFFDENIYIAEDLLFNFKYMQYIKNMYYCAKKMYHYMQYNDSSYNGFYNERWNTVILAYNQIDLIMIKEKQVKSNYRYSYLYALLNLKEKIMRSNFNNQSKLQLEELIKTNKKGIFLNFDLDFFIKFKIFLKLYFMEFFIIMKWRNK